MRLRGLRRSVEPDLSVASGARGRDRVGPVIDRDGDVADAVGTRRASGGIGKLAHRRALRVTESVAGAHAHQRPFGTQRAKQRRRHRLGTAMVPHLEHIDITQRPIRSKGLKHDVLGIPRKERREPVTVRPQHDAGLVGRRILDRCTRPHRR